MFPSMIFLRRYLDTVSVDGFHYMFYTVNNYLLFIFTGNTGMYSPLGERILHLMSHSVGKWECEFDREVRENDTLRNCVQQSEMINPLKPRDAFHGGRTKAFTLFQKDQDISYVDVTSLYPYIAFPLFNVDIPFYRWRHVTKNRSMSHWSVVTFDTSV
jgi:hypothetical protein